MKSNHTLALRLVTGALSLMSLLWLVLRLISYFSAELPMEPDLTTSMLTLVFPTALTLVFGYIAIKGKIPFMCM